MGAEEKLKFMSAQADDAQATEVILQTCVDYVEREVNMDFQQQILAGKTQMVEAMKALKSQMKEEDYSLTEEADIEFVKSSAKSTDVGVVEVSILVSKYTVSEDGSPETQVGRQSVLALAITPTPGSAPLALPTSLISCHLSSPKAACPTDCSIVTTAPGKYEVSYTPVSSGPLS